MIFIEGPRGISPFPSGLGVARPRSEPRLLAVWASCAHLVGPAVANRRGAHRKRLPSHRLLQHRTILHECRSHAAGTRGKLSASFRSRRSASGATAVPAPGSSAEAGDHTTAATVSPAPGHAAQGRAGRTRRRGRPWATDRRKPVRPKDTSHDAKKSDGNLLTQRPPLFTELFKINCEPAAHVFNAC
jgi:hypothetical protein